MTAERETSPFSATVKRHSFAESILTASNRKIAHAIVFGSSKPQNGLLISPARPIIGNKDFLNEIWPTIERMNQVVPKHSRVIKELVLIEDSHLPFALTDKGTVREKITLDSYADRIERAYNELENSHREEVAYPTSFGKLDISAFLQDVLHTLLSDTVLTSEADLFEYGMDSLQATRLRRYIVRLLEKAKPSSPPRVPKNVVYDHPSIGDLVNFILSKLSSAETEANAAEDVKTRVRRSVERFTVGLGPRPHVEMGAAKDGNGYEYVVVTGTTGSLGSFVLDQLIDRPSMKRVYCFNRKSGANTTERQLAAFKDRGLDPAKLKDALGDRVTMYDVDLSLPHLGLSGIDYEEIRSDVTHIIHSAWQLNFNLRLEGFERVHIAGVRHLIDLALASPRTKCPRFLFTSSIGTVSHYGGPGAVPEEPFEDESYASLGYGLSKLVGERVCAIAAEKAGLDAAVVRIGQISGSSNAGAWARSEYNPIMFRSCVGLGMVPEDLPAVKWIPSDIAASVTLKQTFVDVNHRSTKGNGTLEYYHLENPTSTPWSVIARTLSQYKERNLSLVPFDKWLSKVRELGVEDAERVPAIRLLAWYESNDPIVPALDVKNTLAIAPELDYGALTPGLLEKYLEYQGM